MIIREIHIPDIVFGIDLDGVVWGFTSLIISLSVPLSFATTVLILSEDRLLRDNEFTDR